jgi:hypothetical protein
METMRPREQAAPAAPSERHALGNVSARALIAAILAMGGGDQPAHAAEPAVASASAEDIAGVDVAELVRRLDANKYAVRKAAEGEIFRRAESHILARGAMPEWIALPDEDAADRSLEQRECLQWLQKAVDQAQTKHLLVATHLETPSEPMPLRALLTELSQQMGSRITLPPFAMQDTATVVQARGDNLWQILQQITLPNDRRPIVEYSNTDAIHIVPVHQSRYRTAADGALWANLNLQNGAIQLLLEPKACLRHWHTSEMRIIRPEEPRGAITKLSTDKFTNQLPMPRPLKPGERVTIEVDVHMTYSRMRTFEFSNLETTQPIIVEGRTVLFQGVSAEPDKHGHYSCEIAFPNLRTQNFSWASCFAHDQDGNRRYSSSFHITVDKTQWFLGSQRPAHITITVPELAEHTQQRTLRFEDVPLYAR